MSLKWISQEERLGGRRALVMGGSIAGLAAAAVLSRHFDEVTVVERDVLDDAASLRKGTPQAQHLHALLVRGIEGFEALLPGTKAELEANGAVALQYGKSFQWYHEGGFKAPYEGGAIALAQSRPLLESVIRRKVKALRNVRIVDGTELLGLARRPDGRGVSGARIRPRREGAAEEVLEADLTVDATGRGSRAGRWLEEIGFPAPTTSEIRVDVGYASRTYARPENDPYPWRALFIFGTRAEQGRVGAISAIEGGRWTVVLGGILRDYPPSDEAGFLEFASSLPHSGIRDFMAAQKPISDIVTYRFPSHLRRHFEKLSRVAEGFVAIGDAVASFNPIYGQGMTTAILGAEALDESLRAARRELGPRNVDGLSQRHHSAIARAIEVPWSMSTGEDLANPGVKGPRPLVFPLMRAYVERVHALAQRDSAITRTFYDVMHMLKPPSALFHPRVLLPVARMAAEDVRSALR